MFLSDLFNNQLLKQPSYPPTLEWMNQNSPYSYSRIPQKRQKGMNSYIDMNEVHEHDFE